MTNIMSFRSDTHSRIANYITLSSYSHKGLIVHKDTDNNNNKEVIR